MRLLGKNKVIRMRNEKKKKKHSFLEESHCGAKEVRPLQFLIIFIKSGFYLNLPCIYFPNPSLNLIFPWPEVDKKKKERRG